jgi:hypothetical protein
VTRDASSAASRPPDASPAPSPSSLWARQAQRDRDRDPRQSQPRITDSSETNATQDALASTLARLGPAVEGWATTQRFAAKSGEVLLVPDERGAVARVLLGQDSSTDACSYAALPGKLPPGQQYTLEVPAGDVAGRQAALLGWALGGQARSPSPPLAALHLHILFHGR